MRTSYHGASMRQCMLQRWENLYRDLGSAGLSADSDGAALRAALQRRPSLQVALMALKKAAIDQELPSKPLQKAVYEALFEQELAGQRIVVAQEHKDATRTLLCQYAVSGNAFLVDRLLQALPERQRPAMLLSFDKEGSTALHYAAGRGHVRVVRLLLQGDIIVSRRLAAAVNDVGWSALTYAQRHNHAPVVLALCQHLNATMPPVAPPCGGALPTGAVAFRTRYGTLRHFIRLNEVGTGTYNVAQKVRLVARSTIDVCIYRYPKPNGEVSREKAAILPIDTMLKRTHEQPLYSYKDGGAIGVQLNNIAVVFLEVTARHSVNPQLPDGSLMQHYPDGNLCQWVNSANYTMDAAIDYALQAVCGTANIHHAGYFACDLKAENTFLMRGRADHCDLSGRRRVSLPDELDRIDAADVVGTRSGLYVHLPDFVALRQAHCQRQVANYNMVMAAMDVLATAVIVYSLFTKHLPFASVMHGNRKVANLNTLDLQLIDEHPELAPEQKHALKALFLRTLDQEPARRGTAQALAEGLAAIFPAHKERLLARSTNAAGV